MFDDKNFTRSKLYFRTQQLCRVFSGCIDETIHELHSQYDEFMRSIKSWDEYKRLGMEDNLERLSNEWGDLLATRESKLQALLERLRKKGEEVRSLRDGVSPSISISTNTNSSQLFNATSVREASKGTEIAEISVRQNQYIFVFTVVTVIYLPLGFVTVSCILLLTSSVTRADLVDVSFLLQCH